MMIMEGEEFFFLDLYATPFGTSCRIKCVVVVLHREWPRGAFCLVGLMLCFVGLLGFSLVFNRFLALI